eukprot:jgi/Mesen1/7014/ME000365S06155
MGTVVGDTLQKEKAHGYEYDLVVLGGGSGGLATAKEAAKLGAKVACIDYVTPTPQGTQWGLGGTCVNVGCIPKKLMHHAGLLGESFADAREFGWKVQVAGHDWSKLVQAVQDYIGSLNWGYRVALRDARVHYINALARFDDPHTVSCTDRRGKVTLVTGQNFVIAVGGRPRYLGVPGDTELCLTSDDIFSWGKPPGRVLCVGASYIALETAGFLSALGCDVTVMARSIFLRGFDQEIASHIAAYMGRRGTKFIRPAVPTKFEKSASPEGDAHDKVKVTYKNVETGEEAEDVYDTVVLAVGRTANTHTLALEKAGVEVQPLDGKIAAPTEQALEKAGVEVQPLDGKIAAPTEQTNVPHIYAIGDVLQSRQELTPVAIRAGVLLARRLFAGAKLVMDYSLVPTTVFTPLEYGCVGMSEEDAVATYGADNVEVYMSYFKPLEWQPVHEEHAPGVMHREDNICYAKLVTNKLDSERVLGFHVVSPNAGEITQGYAVALKMKATKDDFDSTVGIHPTISEEFTIMRTTKRSGESPFKSGC